jgi:hypothetical protein
MKTTNRPFQLEDTVPGTFLLQGLFGGQVGGFICVVASCLWQETADFSWVAPLTLYLMVVGAILGVIKATIMWGFYRLTGIRMPALARVAVSSIGAFALAVFMSVQFGANNEDIPIWLILTFSLAVPTAIFVGSNVNPLKLFTSGSTGSRLAAPTTNRKPLTIPPEHQCLGTRFVEWQKHVA